MWRTDVSIPGEGCPTGKVVAFGPAAWSADGISWRRQAGPWTLQVGPATGGSRGWMVFFEDEIHGLGHARTLADGMWRAERDRRRVSPRRSAAP